jgi:hypothetical protein
VNTVMKFRIPYKTVEGPSGVQVHSFPLSSFMYSRVTTLRETHFLSFYFVTILDSTHASKNVLDNRS